MNPRPFPFATIGFRPYPETGEFVTIGALAYDPADLRIAFTLEDARRTGRVTGLFPGLNLGIYRAALQAVREELEAVVKNVNQGELTRVFQGFQDEKMNLFTALTAPREGMIFHPVKGRRLAPDLPQALDEIFRRYVQREDLEPQTSVEKKMEKDITRLFERLNLADAYQRNVLVGDAEYHTRFTFGHVPENIPTPDRVVRPLNLDRKDSTEIYRHGDEWIGRIKRLKKFGHLPPVCVLTVRGPGTEREAMARAFNDVTEELRANQANCVPEADEEQLANFVRLDHGPMLVRLN